MSQAPKETVIHFTKAAIEELQFTEKRYDRRDDKVPGLLCRVGLRSKTFTLKVDYKDPLTGRVKTFQKALGTFPRMNVQAAREAALALKLKGEFGNTSPKVKKTFGDVMDDYVNNEQLKPRTRSDIASYRRRFSTKYEHLRADQVTREVIAAILDPITAKDTHNQFRAYIRAAFKRAGQRFDLPQPVAISPREVSRPPPKTIEDLPGWWTDLLKEPNPQFRLVRAFGLLAGTRPTITRQIEKAWIKSDRIVVPRERMKAHKCKDRGDFLLPLSDQLQSVIKEALRYSPEADPLLWRVSAKAKNGKELRATYIDRASKIGIQFEVRKILADQDFGADVDKNYINRHSHFNECLLAQQRISDSLLKGSELDFQKLFP